MRILMLGWEFPPYISGGLGTACYGLTRALSEGGDQITFVLPKAIGGEVSSHVQLLTPQDQTPGKTPNSSQPPSPTGAAGLPGLTGVVFKAVPSQIASPYGGGLPAGGAPPYRSTLHPAPGRLASGASSAEGRPNKKPYPTPFPQPSAYTGDLPAETQRYAALCVDLARGGAFDVIHAHDWLTFPAAAAVSDATGTPWVAHFHSTEHDRSGEQPNTAIAQIEHVGTHRAHRVIAGEPANARPPNRALWHGSEPVRGDLQRGRTPGTSEADDEAPGEP